MLLLASPGDGEILDARGTMYPSHLEVARGSSRRLDRATSTVYGVVVAASAVVSAHGFKAELDAGGFFALPGAGGVEVSKDGCAVLIERHGYRGLIQAGRIEDKGRLAYIDGCSDTVLCSPARLGDPVLNHLHFPVGVVQSVHSHPSIRLGVVVRGAGSAFGPTGGGWERPLEVGSVFLLHAHELHAFRTTDSSLDVIAFHPDSDSGPTDGEHPMLNRTYLADRRKG
jgi:hypothetical protein